MRRLWSALAGSRTPPDGKTENSVRSLALDPITLEALRRHATQRSRPSSWGLVVVFDDVRLPEGDRVLDVGCGTGTISLASAKRGAETVGLDASESYLDGARRLRSHPNVTYVKGRGDAQVDVMSMSRHTRTDASSIGASRAAILLSLRICQA